MIVAIPREIVPGEARAAATPDTAGRMKGKGFQAAVEAGAGARANYSDADYIAAGAEIVPDAAALYGRADIVLKVQPPEESEVPLMKPGAVLISTLRPFANRPLIQQLTERKISAFALELVPRISRAQSMDILSSQANLAGYKAVIMAAEAYRGLFPMLMTAAGTVKPARVLVLGAGVAGLQAIATAKRLGAVVSAFDVRAAVKEQVKSLGAQFVEIDLGIGDAEGKGGYARVLTEEESRRQVELLSKFVKLSDIVITTAAIPGKKAPILVTAETVRGMRPGSVIVDLAAEGGGNCETTKADEIIIENGVTVIGTTNLPSRLSTEASNLFSRNVAAFLFNMLNKSGEFAIDPKDEIVAGSLVTHAGKIVHPALRG